MPIDGELVNVTRDIRNAVNSIKKGDLEEFLQECRPERAVQLALAEWSIYGERWPCKNDKLYVVAHQWQHSIEEGKSLWIATVVFMDDDWENTSVGFWKSFSVPYKNGCLDPGRDCQDQLKELLKDKLLDRDP